MNIPREFMDAADGDAERAVQLLVDAHVAERRAVEEHAAELARLRRSFSDSTCRVGVAVLLRRADGRLLMGRRKGSHGHGQWSVPGGKVNSGETPRTAAVRELEEETGLLVRNLRMLPCWNHDRFGVEHGDYVTLWAVGEVIADAPVALMEPDKCAEWRWVKRDEMPRPLFGPFASLLAYGHDPWRFCCGGPST